MDTPPSAPTPRPGDGADRRGFLGGVSSLAMTAGLAGSYGTFAYVAGRYLYPARGRPTAWVFVTELARVAVGESLEFRAPTGERIALARQRADGNADDFVALSSTCPHLGCQVHWEGHAERFFCPCHNGVFDPSGVATAGPPADAGQSLARYPLEVHEGMLFIEVPTESLTTADAEHDGPREGPEGRTLA